MLAFMFLGWPIFVIVAYQLLPSDWHWFAKVCVAAVLWYPFYIIVFGIIAAIAGAFGWGEGE